MIITRLEVAKEDRVRIETEVEKLKDTVDEIKIFMQETRSGFKLLMALLGMSATLGALVDRIIGWANGGG